MSKKTVPHETKLTSDVEFITTSFTLLVRHREIIRIVAKKHSCSTAAALRFILDDYVSLKTQEMTYGK